MWLMMDWLDWCQASDHSLHSSGGWRDQSNRWGEASDCALRSSGGWRTGQTDDDRHLIIHCVHLVDDWLVRLVMTGILSFIAFIWWMTDWSDWWWQASYHSLRSSGAWWDWSDWWCAEGGGWDCSTHTLQAATDNHLAVWHWRGFCGARHHSRHVRHHVRRQRLAGLFDEPAQIRR